MAPWHLPILEFMCDRKTICSKCFRFSGYNIHFSSLCFCRKHITNWRKHTLKRFLTKTMFELNYFLSLFFVVENKHFNIFHHGVITVLCIKNYLHLFLYYNDVVNCFKSNLIYFTFVKRSLILGEGPNILSYALHYRM